MPQQKGLDDWQDLGVDDWQPYEQDTGFASGYGLPSLQDIGLTALKIPIQLGETLVGLGDIATGGYLGKGLGYLGYDPKMTKDFIASFETDELKKARQQFGGAQGIGDAASAVYQNPGLAGLAIEESLPYLVGGSGIARGALRVAPRMAPWIAGAIGEGVIGAGQQAAQIREDKGDFDWTDIPVATGSGALTGVLSGAGGRIAGKLGLPDIDTILADQSIRGVRRIPALLGGGLLEAGEEAAQSAQEQAAINYATGKPLGQGVGPSALMGGVAGGVMGSIGPSFRSPHERFNPVGDMSGYQQQGLPFGEPGPTQQTLIPHPINEFDRLSDLGVRDESQQTELDALRQQLGADQRGVPQPPGIDPFTQRFRKIPTGPPTQMDLGLGPQTDESGQIPLFGDQTLPPKPSGGPPGGGAGGGGIPTQQQAPITDIPEGTSLSSNQQVVTIHAPNAQNIEYWRSKGYVPVMGLVDANGRPQMVRGDVAPLYVTGDKRAKPGGPAARQQQGTPDIPGPVGGNEIGFVPGQPVEVENGRINKTFIENMAKMGYGVAQAGPTHTRFEPKVDQDVPRFEGTEGPPDIPTGQWPPGQGPFVSPVNQPQGVQETPGLQGMGPVPTRGNVPPQMQMPPQGPQGVQGELPFPVRPQMDPRMAARVEAGGPRTFDFTQPPPQQGNLFPMEVAEPDRSEFDADLRAIRLRQAAERMANPPAQEPVQLSMEDQMKDAEIADYLRREDATPPEMRDLSEYQQGDFGDEEPTFARVQGGGLTASVNITRAVENITRDYTSPLPAIQAREGMQNGLDASDKLGKNGEVRVRLNSSDNTIEIADNGSGLDEDGLATKLVEIFATGKEGEEGATGGKGIGSASYIYGGKHFTVETVAVDKKDGQKYRIIASGTPEQFLDPVKGSDFEKIPVSKSTPTGTTITVVLKDEQDLGDANNMVENVVKNSRNRPSKVLVDEHGSSSGDHLRDADPKYFTEYKFPNSKDDKMVGDFTTTNRNSEVKILIPKSKLTTGNSEIKIHYLNNGMYQFSETMHVGEGEDVPDRVLVDIHPLVDDLNDLYPFINTREDIKRDIREEVTNFIKENIKNPAISKRKNRVQELYDSMSFVPVKGTQRKTVIFDPGNRLTKQEMRNLTANPTIQELVRVYDRAIANILNATGRQAWIDRVEGVGIVLDPNMHGVHIPNPTTGKSTILINPFERIASETPSAAAWNNAITNLHEAGHVGKEHGTPIQLTPQDLQDPRLGEFLSSYMNQLVKHGDVGMWTNTGHGMDFAHRLGEVYAKFGVQNTFNLAQSIHAITTRGGQSGGYSPEVQRLLQLYQESRGRQPTTEDLLSGTGVKSPNRGQTTTSGVSGNTQTNATGVPPKRGFRQRFGIGQGVVPGGVTPPPKKVKGQPTVQETNWVKEALAVPTNATTMLDLSAPGRQGLSMILTPEFWKAVPRMFGALHYNTYKQIDANLRAKPIMQEKIDLNTGKRIPSFAEQIGTKIFSPASEPGPHAEQTASKWLEAGIGKGMGSKLWYHTAGYPIRATNRAFITFLNHLNINRTEKLLNLAKDMSVRGLNTGRTAMPGVLGGINLGGGRNLGFTQKVSQTEAINMNPYHNIVLAKEIAEFVNAATGHATPTNSLEKAVAAVGPVLFSPGLLNSRIRMLNPHTYVMASPFVRKQYLKAALSTAAAWFIMSQLAKNMAGEDAEVSDDITSADFGKVRVGDARLDLGGGFLQFAVAYGRAYAGGSTSSASGEFHRFGSGYQAQTQEDMMERFFVNKLNPVAKFAFDIASATEYNPVHMGDRALQLFVPLLGQDLLEIAKENPDLLPMFGTASMFGGGTQIYSKGESVAKFIDPENDWLVTGGGLRDIMPWNWGAEQGQGRNFPWSEEQ